MVLKQSDNNYPYISVTDNVLSSSEIEELLTDVQFHPPRTEWEYEQSIRIDPELAARLKTRLDLPVRYGGFELDSLNDHFRYSRYCIGGHTPLHVDGVSIIKI